VENINVAFRKKAHFEFLLRKKPQQWPRPQQVNKPVPLGSGTGVCVYGSSNACGGGAIAGIARPNFGRALNRFCRIAPAEGFRGEDALWLGSGPSGMSTESCEPALFGSAHVLRSAFIGSAGLPDATPLMEMPATGAGVCSGL